MNLVSVEDVEVKIRYMTAKDIVWLENIDAYNELGWGRHDFIEFNRPRDHIILVSEYGNQPVGFAACETNKDNIYITNMAVSNVLRRRTVGTQLLERLKNGFLKKQRTKLQTVINEKNLEAQLFFRKNNFLAIKVITEFFDRDDGYLFEYQK